jgi:hypothetical protein
MMSGLMMGASVCRWREEFIVLAVICRQLMNSPGKKITCVNPRPRDQSYFSTMTDDDAHGRRRDCRPCGAGLTQVGRRSGTAGLRGHPLRGQPLSARVAGFPRNLGNTARTAPAGRPGRFSAREPE